MDLPRATVGTKGSHYVLRESVPVVLRNLWPLVIFQGGGPDPLSQTPSPLISVHGK